ncbi:MAG: alpha/beta hydrolase [Clostridiaceae bacterium]
MKLSIEEKIKIITNLRQKDAKKPVDPAIMAKYPIKEIREMFIPTRTEDAHIYVHYPLGGNAPYPVYVNIHGGGFVKGHFQVDELFCRKIANKVGCVVIDIDYKLAPEFMFPYALNECYDVIKWAYDHSEELSIDKNRIALGGHSAGGNLAAGIALMANESNDFKLACQILDYPSLDLLTDPANKNFIDPVIPLEKARLYNDMYVNEEDKSNPLASPVFASTEMLKDLPPTLILTAELDRLRDEAEKYALLLIQAGVGVSVKRFIGARHGFTIKLMDDYEISTEMIVRTLRNTFIV